MARSNATDAELRQLLGDLAEAERVHEETASLFDPAHQPRSEREEEGRLARQLFALQVIQPGLVGLMDGSVATLAPLFAAAFATKNTWNTFLVELFAIAWIRKRYMESPFATSLIQVVVGGLLVFLAGILIGSG